MALNQIVRGIQSNAAGSNPFTARGGNGGDLIVSPLHGDLYQPTYDASVFAVQGTAVTTTAGAAATFTGLAVGNPSNSGYNLVLDKMTVTQAAALTAATNIGIMYGPATAPITGVLATVANRKIGGATSITTSSVGQTITAPTLWTLIGGSGSGAMTVPGFIPSLSHDFQGSLIIPPGYFFASYTSAISTTALLFNFQWEEVPI